MKKLIFLLIGFFCFAHGQYEKQDSIATVEKIKILDAKIKETKNLLKKDEQVQKEGEMIYRRLKAYIQYLLTEKTASNTSKVNNPKNQQAIKAENRIKPVTEIEIPDGEDNIRGGWIYRLFHKNDYYIKRYKLVNNEKVYLD